MAVFQGRQFLFSLPLVEIQASLFENEYLKSGFQTHSPICKLSKERTSKELGWAEYHTLPEVRHREL